MSRAAIRWVRPPDRLGEAVERYGTELVMGAIMAVAGYIAAMIQNSARANAPWTDRTGNARSGLFATAEQAARDLVMIYLSHGHAVEYGIWLELAHGGRYAIVMPTIEAHLPDLERLLQGLFD